MFDYHLTNQAPNADACVVRVFDNNNSVSINFWRDEDQSVHLRIDDSGGNQVDLVLGQESVTYKN